MYYYFTTATSGATVGFQGRESAKVGGQGVRAESEAWQAVCEPVALPHSTVHKESVWEGKHGGD
jgi:hypothetical protein